MLESSSPIVADLGVPQHKEGQDAVFPGVAAELLRRAVAGAISNNFGRSLSALLSLFSPYDTSIRARDGAVGQHRRQGLADVQRFPRTPLFVLGKAHATTKRVVAHGRIHADAGNAAADIADEELKSASNG